MEETILIFGHKNPDTDTICSSIVKEKLNKKMGQSNCKAVRLGNINKETEFILNYLGIEAPELIEKVEEGQKVIMADLEMREELWNGKKKKKKKKGK